MSQVEPLILLVEDDPANAVLMCRRLNKRGYRVIDESNGARVIAKLQEHRPDLILMDMSLPGIDGWTLAEQIKRDPLTRRIPIIAVTAHAMQGDRQKALAAGCDEYVPKPVNFSQLVKLIESFTQGSNN